MNYFSNQIIVICGPMKSGKSKELFIQMDKLKYAKIPYFLFKPDIDSRSGSNVSTRYLDCSEKAIPISTKNPLDIFKHLDLNSLKTPFYVIIDEAQFFDSSIVSLVAELNAKGVGFIISGLDLDAKGKTFGSMGDLLALSTKVFKMTAICESCLNTATRSALKKYDPDFEKNNVKIGDTETYEVLCLNCFYSKN